MRTAPHTGQSSQLFLDHDHASFKSWLLDKHQRVEQTAGLVILFIELIKSRVFKLKSNPEIGLSPCASR